MDVTISWLALADWPAPDKSWLTASSTDLLESFMFCRTSSKACCWEVTFFLVSTSVYLLGIDEPDRLNPDHIVLMENVEDTAKSRLDELKSPALWKNIKAVQKDQVYIVEQQLWNRGIAPIGSTPIIDQVLKIVK